MARGWESKSVESQMEEIASRRSAARSVRLTPAEIERNGQRESLLLSRTRILHDLESAQNPRYRETLLAALKHLDDKLGELQ